MCLTLAALSADGELNVLEDILTEAPDHDDELYNPESERDLIDKKGIHYSFSRLYKCVGEWGDERPM